MKLSFKVVVTRNICCKQQNNAFGLFSNFIDQMKFLRNFVCHNEPRYAYPAAYKTTDDLLHLILIFDLLDLYNNLVISCYY